MGKGKGKGHSSSSNHHQTTGQTMTGQTSPLVPTTSPNTTNTHSPRRCTPVGFSASNSIPANTFCHGQAPFTLFTFSTPFQNAVAAQFTVPAAANACHVTFTIRYSNGSTQTAVVGPGESTIVNLNRNLGVTSVTAACGTGGGPCGGTATLFFTECV